MPWIDNEKPSIPIVTEKEDANFGITYNGNKRIKGFAFFIGSTKEKAVIRKIVYNKNAEFKLDDLLNSNHTKVFIASISTNNVLSEMVELK